MLFFRLFCHGLPTLGSTVLVFSTDKAYTRGNIYALDTSKGCVVSEICMEPVREQLLDVHLIKALPSAVVGLTLKQNILIWSEFFLKEKKYSVKYTLALK